MLLVLRAIDAGRQISTPGGHAFAVHAPCDALTVANDVRGTCVLVFDDASAIACASLRPGPSIVGGPLRSLISHGGPLESIETPGNGVGLT